MHQQIKSYKLRKLSKTVASVAFGVFMTAGVVYAAPAGGKITAGSGKISRTGNKTTISQTSDRLDINWSSFNISAEEAVHFDQMSSSAIAINRIQDVSASQINGSLTANGRVFLINKAGITFGAGSYVNVDALVATTSDIIDFSGEGFKFKGGHNGSRIQNFGDIQVSEGGFAVLSAPYVINEGTINAKDGLIALGSSTEFSLDIAGRRVNFLANDATAGIIGVNASGSLSAQGGAVVIKAKQAVDIATTMINLDGGIDVSAHTAGGQVGLIDIFSEGNLDAQAGLVAKANAHTIGKGGKALLIAEHTAVFRDGAQVEIKGGHLAGEGGFTEFSGYDRLHVLGSGFNASGADGSGMVLFDPRDITIASGGGAAYTDVDLFSDNAGLDMTIAAATLVAIDADITLEATQDIFINENILHSSNAGRAVTLRAGRHITMQAGTVLATDNAAITLSADHDFSGVGGAASDDIGDITLANVVSQGGDINIINTEGQVSLQDNDSILSDGGNINITKTGGQFHTGNGNMVDAGTGDVKIEIIPQSGDLSELVGTDEIWVGSTGQIMGDNIILRAGQIRDSNTGFTINFIAANSITLRGETMASRKQRVSGLRTETLAMQTPHLIYENDYDHSSTDLRVRNFGNLLLTTTAAPTGITNGIGEIQVIGDLTFDGRVEHLFSNTTRMYIDGDFRMTAGSSIKHTQPGGEISITADNDNNGVGNIFMANGASLTNRININLTAANRIELGLITGGNLNLSSRNSVGVLVDTNGDDLNFVGNHLVNGYFYHAFQIGEGSNYIETDMNALYQTINTPQDVFIKEANDVIFDGTNDSGTTNINLLAAGNITTNGVITKTTGALNLQAEGDLILTDDITSDSAIILRAGENLTMTAGKSIVTNNADVTITADYDFSGSGGTVSDDVGDITLAGITTAGGDINISNTEGDITLLTGNDLNSSGGDINITKVGGEINIQDNSNINSGTGTAKLEVLSVQANDLFQFNNTGRISGQNVILRGNRIYDTNTTAFVNVVATNNLTISGESYSARKAHLAGQADVLNTQTPNIIFENLADRSSQGLGINNVGDTVFTTTAPSAGNSNGLSLLYVAGDLTYSAQIRDTNSYETDIYATGDITMTSGSFYEQLQPGGRLSLTSDSDRNNDGNIFMAADSSLIGRNFVNLFAHNRIEVALVKGNRIEVGTTTAALDGIIVDVNGDALNFDARWLVNGSSSGQRSLQIGEESNQIETKIESVSMGSHAPKDTYINEVDDITFINTNDIDTTNVHIKFGGNLTVSAPVVKTTGSVHFEKTGVGDFDFTQNITTDSGDINLVSTAGNLDITGVVSTTSGNLNLAAANQLNLNQNLTTTSNANLTATDIVFGASGSLDADKVILKASNSIDAQNVVAQSADTDALILEDAATISNPDDASAHYKAENGGVVLKNITATDVDLYIDASNVTFDTVNGDIKVKNEKAFNFETSTYDGIATLETVDGAPLAYASAEAQAIRDALTLGAGSVITLNGESLTVAPPPPPAPEGNAGQSKDKVKDAVNQSQNTDSVDPSANQRPIDSVDFNKPNNSGSNSHIGDVDVVQTDDTISIGNIDIEIETSSTPTTEVKVSADSNEDVDKKDKSSQKVSADDDLVKLLLDFIPDHVLNLTDLTAYLAQAQRKKL